MITENSDKSSGRLYFVCVVLPTGCGFIFLYRFGLRGDFRTCLCDEISNVYAFRRTCGEDESLVVLNAGSEPVKTKIAAEGTWTPRISGRKPVSSESGGITVDLAPCSAEIYQKKAKGRK